MKRISLAMLLGLVVASPVVAQDDNARDGFRIEARAAYETPTISSVIADDDVYKLGSAFGFGGEIGFDLAAAQNLVVGPYGQYTISSVENCDGGFCVNAKGYAEGGVHLGYAVGSSGQLFGKLGYGQLSLETTGLGLDTTAKGEGVAFALGYEQGFGETLYGRVEFGYADVGEIYTINFQRRHATLAVGARF